MSTTEADVPTISPAELARRRDDDDLYVLDVRRADEYDQWAIEGTRNLPIYDALLDEEFDDLAANLDTIPSDREVAVVCVAGITSARAAAFLRERGYDARSLEGGMRAWGRLHLAYDVDAAEGVIQVVRPGTGCVSYLVHDGDRALVVDPSQYLQEYRGIAADRGLELVGGVDTHAHADHVSGGRALVAAGLPYYLHDDDAGSLSGHEPIADGDRIAVGDRELSVVHTPGHTPGSVCLRAGDALLTGDTLFLRSVGRPDLEDGSEDATRAAARDLFESLQRLRELPEDTPILPGHFSDDPDRPLVGTLGELARHNRLFATDDPDAFADAVVEGLAETPANYRRIKAINWGERPITDEDRDLELGPNNCAAN